VELNKRREGFFPGEHNGANCSLRCIRTMPGEARRRPIYSCASRSPNALQRSANERRSRRRQRALADKVLAAVRAIDGRLAVREMLTDLARDEVEFVKRAAPQVRETVIERMARATNSRTTPTAPRLRGG